MTITALPTPPSRSDSANFATRGDAFLAALPTFATEANALQADVNAKQATASAAATSATDSAAAALVSANNAAADAGAALWVSGTTYSLYVIVRSPLNSQTYKRIVAGAGTTDPSLDTTNWAPRLLDVSTTLPAMRPSLLLDFANAQAVDGRITFTRASTAQRINSKGLIETVASGVPRIDYDPVTLACKGLLIEEARTNLLTYSEQFDNAAWTKTRSSITANAATAPDGSTTADKIVEDATASNSHFIAGPVVSTVSGTAYSLPIFIKSAERSWVFITGHSSSFGSGVFAFFNAATGAVGTTAGCTATCTPVGNGWFRASITATATVTGSQVAYQLNLTTGDATYNHTGDGTSGLYLWGAQLEAGAFPTSYIPTTSAQVTRAADVATMTGANFSSWYRQEQGTFLIDAWLVGQAAVGAPTLFLAQSVSGNDRISIRQGAVLVGADVLAASNGVTTVDTGQTAFAAGQRKVFGFGYANNDSVFVADGSLVDLDTACAFPTTNAQVELQINAGGASSYHISRFAYYPKRLTNAELQALTAQ